MSTKNRKNIKTALCFSCRRSLIIAKEEYTKYFWKQRKSLFTLNKDFIISRPYCKFCLTELTKNELAAIGMKHLAPKKISAMGTNFYKIYARSPVIYNQFSWAEDPENKILHYILRQIDNPKNSILDVACGTGKYS